MAHPVPAPGTAPATGGGRDAQAAADLLAVTGLRIAAGHRTIVDGVDVAVAAGESVALVGESGSGKSMTARAVTGLLPPGVTASGAVRFEGTEVLADPRRHRRLRGAGIGLLLQDPFTMLNPLTTVRTHLAETLASRADAGRLTGRSLDREVRRRLAEVGITRADVAARHPFELSGGMRQRVALAAAIAKDPRLLIADEPTTALDATTQRAVLRLIRRIQTDRGMGLLLITHDMRVAFAMCDRVLVMYAGSIVEVARPRDLDLRPRHPYTAGLLAAEPELGRRAELRGIPGSVPRPDDVAGVCPFSPRCDWRADVCTEGRPVLRVVQADHLTACARHDGLEEQLGSRRATDPVPAPAVPEPEPVLEITGLTKVFGRRRAIRRGEAVTALDAVDVTVRRGRHLAIVGESGSGKTTIARCILGLETPTAGRIVLGGLDVSDRSRLDAAASRRARNLVQCVFQDPYSSLNPSHSVGFALAEAVRLHAPDASGGSGSGGVRAEVAALLRQVGLPEGYAERRPAALSGGERQRVAIARALAVRPEVVVCDEPVAALDVSVQAQVLAVLRRVGESGTTLVFITHDLAVARQLTDDVLVLQQGTVVERGRTEDVLNAPQHAYTKELLASVPTGAADWLA